ELEVQDAVLDRVAHRDLTAGGQLQLRPVRIELLHLDASTLQVELQRRLVEVQCREADAALQLGVDDARSVERKIGHGARVTGVAAVALDRPDTPPPWLSIVPTPDSLPSRAPSCSCR